MIMRAQIKHNKLQLKEKTLSCATERATYHVAPWLYRYVNLLYHFASMKNSKVNLASTACFAFPNISGKTIMS